MTPSRRPIPFKAICAIARRVLTHRPHFSDCEWKEAVKLMAARQGWVPPTNAQLAPALDAVERAMAKDGHGRSLPVVESPTPRPGGTWRPVTHAEAVALLGNVKAQLVKRGLPASGL